MTTHDRTASRLTEEASRAVLTLARQLAAQMAEDSFRAITAAPGWTIAHVDAATEMAIARMEIATRDALAARGGDPDDQQWQLIWTTMVDCYQQMTADLLIVSGLRPGEPLQ